METFFSVYQFTPRMPEHHKIIISNSVFPLPLSLLPSCRYALICQQCFSHNGMALKEEFEYLGKNRNTLLHLMRRANLN